MGDTEDDNGELDDNSNHGRRIHPVKPDSEACDKETTNDSVDVINKTADDVKEKPVTLNSASKGKAARKSIPREGVHSSPIGAGLEDDKAKQEDNSIEDENEFRKSTECIEKEIKHGKACYCTKCDSEIESKENFDNHMYEAHVSPTTTCGNCHTTFKDILYLESHKKGCND